MDWKLKRMQEYLEDRSLDDPNEICERMRTNQCVHGKEQQDAEEAQKARDAADFGCLQTLNPWSVHADEDPGDTRPAYTIDGRFSPRRMSFKERE